LRSALSLPLSRSSPLFKNFAQLIALHLDAQERAARQDAALVDAREAADLREQFVAILAHDLRNPLASIDAGINVLLRSGPDEKTLRDVGGHIRNSAKRMAGLIEDMLDFAKRRLGGGFSLDRNPDAPLQEHLEQVIDELRDVSKNTIEAQINLWHPVYCDPKRIAQSPPISWPKLAIDIGGLHIEICESGDGAWIFFGPVEPGASEELHAAVVDARGHAIAVQLYLVHPLCPRRRR
jgi:His Kinase A (phospho-acceptor) domain